MGSTSGPYICVFQIVPYQYWFSNVSHKHDWEFKVHGIVFNDLKNASLAKIDFQKKDFEMKEQKMKLFLWLIN
jgi:hypothetical protein